MNDRRKCREARNGNALVSAGKAFSAMGMPADADGRLPVVTVTGGRYAKVEHHRGVLLFTDRSVRLYSRLGIIRIEGNGLVSRRMDTDVLVLEGEIASVCFER